MSTAVSAAVEPLVSLRGIGKTYAGRRILDDVAVTIDPGKVVGLVGPNGAGKTTLIKIIAGLVAASAGTGTVLGLPLAQRLGKMPFLGIMVERPMFIEDVSGRRNLLLLAGIRKQVSAERVTEVLDGVGLDPHDRRPVRSYSLGMRQRLSLAQALLEKPSLIVLDEPTNGLDPIGIVQMRGLVRELATEHGMGVLLASHLLSEVEAVCDTILLLSQGRVQQVYSRDEGCRVQTMILKVERPEHLISAAELEGVEIVRHIDSGCAVVSVDDSLAQTVKRLVEADVSVEEFYRETGALERAYIDMVQR